jgi:hypothetical protein
MKASSCELSQKKIDSIAHFFALTSGQAYGWREGPMTGGSELRG